MSIKTRIRDWLGITELDERGEANYRYLKIANDVLYKDYNEHTEQYHRYIKPNGSVEATGYAAYEPEQHGNVVVTEPKLMKVLRRDIEV